MYPYTTIRKRRYDLLQAQPGLIPFPSGVLPPGRGGYDSVLDYLVIY